VARSFGFVGGTDPVLYAKAKEEGSHQRVAGQSQPEIFASAPIRHCKRRVEPLVIAAMA
jgi:hypothetical protein